MIAVVGYVAILVALSSAVALAVQGLRVGLRGGAVGSLRVPVLGLVAGAAAAFVLLEAAILSHDFSIAYVAANTARATPFLFLLAAGWAALEGSIVLWGLVLAVFTWLVWRRVASGDGLGITALGVVGLVAVFWFGLMATAANPFGVCTEVAGGVCVASSWLPAGSAVAPLDGLGPNPLLQNHILMAVHPPMLYVGYVGLTVPFAFAIAALVRGERGAVWLDRTHRWTVVAWTFLTAGIFLGAWWSYEVLGWGGYWAWDPVENAALLPWLVATAFLHSALVQRKRGMLQAWNFVLVISAFALTILGTFLTRSGVIASVHSFTQSAVGPALLGFLVVVVVASLGIFAWRVHLVASPPRLESLASREGGILANNLLLTLFAFTVLVGTMYPLIYEAFSGDTVSVGRPFFDRVTVPLAFALLLAVGAGSVAPWRVARWPVMWRRLRAPVNWGLVVAAAAVVIGVRSIAVVAAVGLGAFVIAAVVGRYVDVVRAQRQRAQRSVGRALATPVRNDPGYWGGQISHVGLALAAIAIATTSGLAATDTVALTPGDTAVVGGYCIRYVEPFSRQEPARRVDGVVVEVGDASCDRVSTTLEPRLHHYPNTAQPVATPAVWTGLVDDVYVSLAGGSLEAVQLRVSVFPLQWLLWAAGAVVVLGGVVALGRKLRVAPVAAPGPEREPSGV